MAGNILFDGWTSLESGVNSGLSPSLIPRNQCAFASNISFRGGFPHTRAPYEGLLLTFEDDETETNWTGIFQGACFYQAEFGQNGFIVSRGGRLFRIQMGLQNIVSDITPSIVIVTTADFTVPAPAANVTVDVNSEAPFTVGDTVFIDSGQYTVAAKFTKQLLLTYVGGAANAVAPEGSSVLDSASAVVYLVLSNPADLDFVFLFQAENYVIVLAAPHKTIIYDGAMARQAGINEVPPGILGAYGWGRIWITLQDRRQFVAGDIVYGPSGTDSLGRRDAILKFTENDIINEGFAFGVPINAGPITGMMFLATQDTSLGMGVLLVSTTNMVFSVNAPVDRTIWKSLQYPIQTVSLIDYGPTGPRHLCSVNGDMWYRSHDSSARSFIVARRDIQVWGNTPMSREVDPLLFLDDKQLLFYGSSVNFDNRWFTTISPYRTSNGVLHRGMACINFDLISSLKGKSAPAWEGIGQGLDIYQIAKGNLNGVEQCFAFVQGDSDIELWRIHAEADAGYYDNFITRVEITDTITRTAIDSVLESGSFDYQTPFQPKILNMGELFLDEIVDTVELVIKFRPDQYPAWITWASLSFCADVTQCTITAPTTPCHVWKTNLTQYAARITIPAPPDTCNTIAGIPVDRGHEFQFRFEITGHCRLRRFRTHSILQKQETEGVCQGTVTCKTFESCTETVFDYDAHSGNVPVT